MTFEDFAAYAKRLGYSVEVLVAAGVQYAVLKDYIVPSGGLKGATCDVAFQILNTVPATFPPAIHTRPAIARMDFSRLRTQPHPNLPGWQYWSRLFTKPTVTPQLVFAHIATIFSEVAASDAA